MSGLFDDLPDHAMTPKEREQFMNKLQPPKSKKKGYAAIPGTGPEGETCRSCKHSVIKGGTAKNYYKCALMRNLWTGGQGTDILLRSPACRRWEKDSDAS